MKRKPKLAAAKRRLAMPDVETVRTTITMPLAVREAASRLMKERLFSDFSGFLAQLIRDEIERRNSKPPVA